MVWWWGRGQEEGDWPPLPLPYRPQCLRSWYLFVNTFILFLFFCNEKKVFLCLFLFFFSIMSYLQNIELPASINQVKRFGMVNSLLWSRLNFLLAARCSLLFVGCSLLFAGCLLLFARCPLLFARCSLLFADCALLFARCLLLFRPSYVMKV